MEAMIFMMIFGACLIFAALTLRLSRDPRQSVFLARVHKVETMPLEKAKEKAREVSGIVAIVGIVLIAVCGLVILFGGGISGSF